MGGFFWVGVGEIVWWWASVGFADVVGVRFIGIGWGRVCCVIGRRFLIRVLLDRMLWNRVAGGVVSWVGPGHGVGLPGIWIWCGCGCCLRLLVPRIWRMNLIHILRLLCNGIWRAASRDRRVRLPSLCAVTRRPRHAMVRCGLVIVPPLLKMWSVSFVASSCFKAMVVNLLRLPPSLSFLGSQAAVGTGWWLAPVVEVLRACRKLGLRPRIGVAGLINRRCRWPELEMSRYVIVTFNPGCVRVIIWEVLVRRRAWRRRRLGLTGYDVVNQRYERRRIAIVSFLDTRSWTGKR